MTSKCVMMYIIRLFINTAILANTCSYPEFENCAVGRCINH